MIDKKFSYDPKRGGVFAPDFQIVPYPAPIMRRQAIRDILPIDHHSINRNKYIEIGFGSGIFAYEFYKLGFDVFGYELSDAASQIADKLFNSDKHRITIKSEITEQDKAFYDILGAYEVLEHCENDAEILSEWWKLLKDEGLLIISVPSHMKEFGLRDIRAGHFRRYEKKSLENLLKSSGFEVLNLISYGFPLPKLIMWLIVQLVDKPHMKSLNGTSESHKTSVSGIGRQEEYKYNKVIPYRLLVLFSKISRFFYKSDLGIGYLVLAKKSHKLK